MCTQPRPAGQGAGPGRVESGRASISCGGGVKPPVAGAWVRVCTVPILPPWWLCWTFRGFFSRRRSVGPGFHLRGLGSCDLLPSAGRPQATAAFSLPNPFCAPVVVSAAGQRAVAWLCLVVSAP